METRPGYGVSAIITSIPDVSRRGWHRVTKPAGHQRTEVHPLPRHPGRPELCRRNAGRVVRVQRARKHGTPDKVTKVGWIEVVEGAPTRRTAASVPLGALAKYGLPRRCSTRDDNPGQPVDLLVNRQLGPLSNVEAVGLCPRRGRDVGSARSARYRESAEGRETGVASPAGYLRGHRVRAASRANFRAPFRWHSQTSTRSACHAQLVHVELVRAVDCRRTDAACLRAAQRRASSNLDDVGAVGNQDQCAVSCASGKVPGGSARESARRRRPSPSSIRKQSNSIAIESANPRRVIIPSEYVSTGSRK